MRRFCSIVFLALLIALSMEWVHASSFCFQKLSTTCGKTVKTQLTKACCKKHRKQKEGQSKENPSTCCLDCPLCCPVTYQPFCRFEYMPMQAKIEYAAMPADQLTKYFRQPWKPPNVFSSS
jgi:hypothetical protein